MFEAGVKEANALKADRCIWTVLDPDYFVTLGLKVRIIGILGALGSSLWVGILFFRDTDIGPYMIRATVYMRLDFGSSLGFDIVGGFPTGLYYGPLASLKGIWTLGPCFEDVGSVRESKYQLCKDAGPKYHLVWGTRNLQYWVLGPSGF